MSGGEDQGFFWRQRTLETCIRTNARTQHVGILCHSSAGAKFVYIFHLLCDFSTSIVSFVVFHGLSLFFRIRFPDGFLASRGLGLVIVLLMFRLGLNVRCVAIPLGGTRTVFWWRLGCFISLALTVVFRGRIGRPLVVQIAGWIWFSRRFGDIIVISDYFLHRLESPLQFRIVCLVMLCLLGLLLLFIKLGPVGSILLDGRYWVLRCIWGSVSFPVRVFIKVTF